MARSEIDDKVEGLDLGANDYLTKPFASKKLLRPNPLTITVQIPGCPVSKT
ncbi:MAG: hypothetical protein V8S27_06550 [Lachnospiraceae bacterium]